MWSGQQQQQQSQQQQKHDIFVGNLAFNTTEEQLHQVFSEVGRVIKVRMVTDNDTGKPRGFAFVEYQDPQAALSAIRNMNDYELNGRRIRVNFSNSSHLEALAGKLGMDMPSKNQSSNNNSNQNNQGGGSHHNNNQSNNNVGAGTVGVTEALKSMSKGEIYDVVQKLKEIADRDPEEARRILSGHPQLPEAILFCMSKLDMVQTPIAARAVVEQPLATAPPPAVPRAADPRAASDPRQRASDPRARADPRRAAAAAAAAAPPPPPPQYAALPPPPQAPLDPALVQQVMSLTPQQIAQLPPDKSQSIMALRNQITGGR